MKKIANWLLRRLKERSTYVGIAAVAAAVGLPEVGELVGQAGSLLTVALGGGLIAASTSPSVPPAA